VFEARVVTVLRENIAALALDECPGKSSPVAREHLGLAFGRKLRSGT
jgi:hypothetical protein